MAWDDTAQIIKEEAADATKVVIELIQQRLKELPALNEKVDAIIKPYRLKPDGSRRKAAELKAILKTVPANVLKEYEKSTKDIYRIKEYLKDEVGTLNRALGELFTAEGKELYFKEGGLFDKLFPDGISGELLSKNLGAFETKLSAYTDTIKSGIERFTVGHHQHLASLRELALETKKRADPKWWAEYTRLLADRGFEIGDKGILRIARQAHKHLLKYKSGPMAGQLNIDGFLKDLGITEKTPGFKQLYEATQKVMAHAGGTGGVKIPLKFALLSPEKALNASLPILEVERAQSQGGLILTNVMRNWSNRIKEGGGEVTEEAINKLTRLTNRLGETLIGTTDGKPNLSFEQFDEKGRLARNVILEQLAEIEKDAVSSGFMDSAMDVAADLAEQKKYESMAGPVKIIQRAKDSIFNAASGDPKNLVKNSIEGLQGVATKVDKVTDVIPGSKFAKKHGLSAIGLLGDTAKVLAHQPEIGGSESEIGTTNYMRNRYAEAAGGLDRVSGATGILSISPDLKRLSHGRTAPLPGLKKVPGLRGLRQQGVLAGISIFTSLGGDRARYLAENYKSDLDKFTDSLLPGTNQDDPELNERFQSKVNEGVYSHSEDNPVEIKDTELSILEKLALTYERFLYD